MKRHLLRTNRLLVRIALHIPPDGAVALRNFKVVHRVSTNTWSVIRWHPGSPKNPAEQPALDRDDARPALLSHAPPGSY
ncbi:hypothetical protein T492DRAFT_893482 [Pavlovales sp. CCMP2436]|nr:hypothetical protein T492DRAFT_893482 [Pavlovales sp. CCMP2436]